MQSFFACQQHNEVIRQAVAASKPGSAVVDIEQGLMPNLIGGGTGGAIQQAPSRCDRGWLRQCVPSASMAQALSVLAVNVNGLSASRKRRAFFLQLLQGNWDVIVLTETHCPNTDIAEQWLREGREGAGPGQPWLADCPATGTMAPHAPGAWRCSCVVGMHVQRSIWIMHSTADAC